MRDGKILVVDDDRHQRDILKEILEAEGYQVEAAATGLAGLEAARARAFDVILTDLKLPDISGIDFLERLGGEEALPCVVVITAHGSIDTAVEAMRKGAFDYLTKPLEMDELLITLRRAFERQTLLRENRRLQQQLGQAFAIEQFVGDHPAVAEVLRVVRKVAESNSTVLIWGESGTGKELIARAIHYSSPRRERRFCALNCAAIPENLLESELFGHERGSFTGALSRKSGLFEEADQGTLFLDEIGEMDPKMQAKILRVLQEREFRRVGGKDTIRVDVRILAASNRDPEELIRAGKLREDLYWRLNVISIRVPPLRERASDIPLLAEHFIRKYNRLTGRRVQGVEPAALAALLQYPWPGNVRQLESVIERAVLLSEGDLLSRRDFPPDLGATPMPLSRYDFQIPSAGFRFAEFEKSLLEQAMAQSGGSLTRAAHLLGMSYRTLQYRLQKYGVRGGRPERGLARTGAEG
jgi:DNA-binding NtrC family response regulator